MFGPYPGGSLPSRIPKGAAQDIRDSASRSRENALELDELEARVERLYLVCQALWTLVKQKTGLTDEQLQKEIEKMDLAEPKPAAASTALVCKDCKRTVSRRHKICIYCGSPDLIEQPGATPLG